MQGVTIITPTFNRAGFLAETIESVLRQDYPDIEHIVLDDGSTDGTGGVLDRFGDRVRVYRHENMGEQATVNRGLGLATRPLVMVVNSDDPLLPGAVGRLASALASSDRLVGVYPDWRRIDETGGVIDAVEACEFDLARMLCFHECHPGPGAMVRTEALRSVGGRDERLRYVADFDQWLRLGLLGPMRRVPEVLATWRAHAESATQAGRGAAMAAEHVEVIRRFFERDDLPRSISSLRRRSVSWAHCAASYHADSLLGLRLKHAAAWALLDPMNPLRWARQKVRAHGVAGTAQRAAMRMRGVTG